MTITTSLAPHPASGVDTNPRPAGTVPDPLSVACESRRCHECDGSAVNVLTDRPAPCTCRCHR